MIKRAKAGMGIALAILSLVMSGCKDGNSASTPEPTISSVTVWPESAELEKGGTQQFSATVNGSNDPPQTVSWSVSGGGSGTGISYSGLLTVGADETAETLTVRATSTADSAKSGAAAVTVKSPESPDPGPQKTLAEQLAWLEANAASNGNYTLEVYADERISADLYYYLKSNIRITLRGIGSERTVSGGFTVASGVTLILDSNITLQGFVSVEEGGTLVMNEGSTITSGGVDVRGGTFTMNGGTISGNTGSFGNGGVYVHGGTFTMNGGTISGNTTYASGEGGGGGVAVRIDGTFTMSGGTISGNTASSGGGGVFVYSGTFTMSGGTISGNTASSGGGVGVYGNYSIGGHFEKTGGTIYGYTPGDGNSNTVKYGNRIIPEQGHAVRAGEKYKDSTAGTGVNLMYDGRERPATFSGAWDN